MENQFDQIINYKQLQTASNRPRRANKWPHGYKILCNKLFNSIACRRNVEIEFKIQKRNISNSFKVIKKLTITGNTKRTRFIIKQKKVFTSLATTKF